ncbi:hypothetical protein N7495_009720 [Penicillium taxi]|uniref:uncharacterized protein n=1 Tax=Penicillium taxi TaxID=168475 RepID=UPI0025453038|nr:uncharacterized protein N7495_009720 [Penicillium taxi]KAJ5885210.1 hypothetical protein N7495_009720 [Penicillium taxi]
MDPATAIPVCQVASPYQGPENVTIRWMEVADVGYRTSIRVNVAVELYAGRPKSGLPRRY